MFAAIDGEVMYTASVGGRFQPKLSCRIATEYITLQDAINDQVTVSCGHTFIVKGGTAECAFQVWSFMDVNMVGKYLFINLIQQEAGLAIETATGDCSDKCRKQTGGNRGFEDHWALPS